MSDLNLALAEGIAEESLRKAASLGIAIAVTIVDRSGRLILCKRQDGAGFFTPETSRAKAVAAAAFGRPTIELVELQKSNPAFWSAVPSLLGEVLPTTGAVPLKIDEKLVGAVGCGGGSADQDHQCALAGAQVLES